MELLLLVLKVALIAFVVGGTIALITRGVRRHERIDGPPVEGKHRPTRTRGVRLWRYA